MSTRALVCIPHGDGARRCIYVHHDGYVDGLGHMLKLYTLPWRLPRLLLLSATAVKSETPRSPVSRTIAISEKNGRTSNRQWLTTSMPCSSWSHQRGLITCTPGILPITAGPTVPAEVMGLKGVCDV